MPISIADRVCETSTTTGTGNFTLAGPITGYRDFDSTVFTNFYYLIEAVDAVGNPAGEWEIGIGELVSPTVLGRVAVMESSTGAAIDFAAGTKRVHLTAPAFMLGSKGMRAKRTTDLTAQNYTTAAAINWNSKVFNDLEPTSFVWSDWHDNATNSSRITVPSVIPEVACKFSAQVALANITSGEWVQLGFRLSGGSTYIAKAMHAAPSTSPVYQIFSPQVTLNGTDYVEVMVQVQTDTSVDIIAADSFFELEILK